MRDVEEPDAGAHGHVFADEAAVLDGHVPAAEVDHFGLVGAMGRVQGRHAQLCKFVYDDVIDTGHLSLSTENINPFKPSIGARYPSLRKARRSTGEKVAMAAIDSNVISTGRRWASSARVQASSTQNAMLAEAAT